MKLREWDSDDYIGAFFALVGIWILLFLLSLLILLWKDILA